MRPKILEKTILYPLLKRYPTKKAAKAAGESGLLILADFGLWGYWYIARGFHGLRLVNGQELPFHQIYLTSGSYIGRRDSCAADGQPFADTWRESLAESNLARM